MESGTREFLKFVGFAAVIVFSLVIVFVLVFAGLILTLDTDPEPDSFSHEIEYGVELRANGSLNDTEFLVPYPEAENFRSALNSSTYNVSLRNEMNASVSIVNTSRGEMLELDIGEFRPEKRGSNAETYRNDTETTVRVTDPGNELNDYNTYDFEVLIDYNRSLDTKKGLESEPHLPANRTRASNCGSIGDPVCFNSTTETFISFNASENTHTELSVELVGRNSWWSLGWSGNEYRQNFYTSFYDDENPTGSQDRWITLTGKEVQSDGVYREE